jgi:hypothetical protein
MQKFWFSAKTLISGARCGCFFRSKAVPDPWEFQRFRAHVWPTFETSIWFMLNGCESRRSALTLESTLLIRLEQNCSFSSSASYFDQAGRSDCRVEVRKSRTRPSSTQVNVDSKNSLPTSTLHRRISKSKNAYDTGLTSRNICVQSL